MNDLNFSRKEEMKVNIRGIGMKDVIVHTFVSKRIYKLSVLRINGETFSFSNLDLYLYLY